MLNHKAFRERRKKIGLTAKELGKMAEPLLGYQISERTVLSYEMDREPSLSKGMALISILGLKFEDIYVKEV